MANPFASSKQPSLFPMTFPSFKISKEEYHLFFNYERALFRILLVILHREVVEATFVVAFLLWLERGGYTSYPLGRTFVNYLSMDVINEVANEVLTCINFLQKETSNLMFVGSSSSYNISKLQCFLDRKPIHLDELYHYGDVIYDEVCCIANEVSAKAFDDIWDLLSSHSLTPANQDTQFMQTHQIAHQYQHQQMVARVSPVIDLTLDTYFDQNLAYMANGTSPNNARVLEREQDELVPPDERTVFLTFSKGYEVTADDVREHFTCMLGECIESIHMQPVQPGSQPLFARMVVRDISVMRAVTGRGVDGKSKYTINGKHVWARKFVPRTP